MVFRIELTEDEVKKALALAIDRKMSSAGIKVKIDPEKVVIAWNDNSGLTTASYTIDDLPKG